MPIRHLPPLLLALGVACASTEPRPTPPAPAPDAGATPARAAAAPTPGCTASTSRAWIRSVAPGDDFFLYANGTWVKDTEIPADRPLGNVQHPRRAVAPADPRAAGGGRQRERARRLRGAQGRRLLRERTWTRPASRPGHGAAPSAARRHRRAPGQDRARPRAGAGPADRRGRAEQRGTSTPSRLFGFWVAPDMNPPRSTGATCSRAAWGCPTASTTSPPTPRWPPSATATGRTSRRSSPGRHPRRRGAGPADLRSRDADGARARHPRRGARGSPGLQPVEADEFGKRAPGPRLGGVLPGRHPAAAADHRRLATDGHHRAGRPGEAVPLATWKEWLTFQPVERSGSPLLSRAFVDESFDFYGKTLSGTPQLSARWKRASRRQRAPPPGGPARLGHGRRGGQALRRAPLSALGQGEDAGDGPSSIIAAFDRRIEALDWMAPATKAQAREKVRTLYVGVGYPERWQDDSGLEVIPGRPAGQRAARLASSTTAATWRSWASRSTRGTGA